MAQVENLPNAANLAFVEALYEDYLENPESVSDEWRSYFEKEMGGLGLGLRPQFVPSSIFNPPSPTIVVPEAQPSNGAAAINGSGATNGASNGSRVSAYPMATSLVQESQLDNTVPPLPTKSLAPELRIPPV